MTDPRRVAVEALLRIDGGAYANLVVPALLDGSGLDRRDRAFVTELVYGTTRMRRACDWLVDRFLVRAPQAPARALLRLGAYQLAFLDTPAHAAVSATVSAATQPSTRGLVNAVLRRVAESLPVKWPDRATALSYPDWIVARLDADLGRDVAQAALEQMNRPAHTHERDDGYVQDPASQDVARHVHVEAGDRVLDACAAPGGKATLMAGGGGFVAAGDVRFGRAGLVAQNAARLGAATVATVCADGRRGPWRAGAFDKVLVDAPCTGLGVLGRRPDARWRIRPHDLDELAALQRALVAAQIEVVRPGGTIVYAVCTLTTAETVDVDAWLTRQHPELVGLPPPPAPWEPVGRGGRILPQTAATDGMYVLALRRAS